MGGEVPNPSNNAQDGGPAAGSNSDTCSDTVFAVDVWKGVLAPNCYGCHMATGFADQSGARFKLAEPRAADYMTTNLAAFEAMAQIQASDGLPLILAKASNAVPHMGGKVLDSNSAGFATLKSFIDRGDLQSTCMPSVDAQAMASTPVQSPNLLARRAALQLAARMPSAAEMQMAQAGNLAGALDSMMTDPNFSSIIKRSYEDTFYNDAFYSGNVIGFLYDSFYGDGAWNPDSGNIGDQVIMGWGEAHNADELASYIIRNDHPYTEILTADYMLVNAQGACEMMGAGHNVAFSTSCTVGGAPANTCAPTSFPFAQYDECYEYQPVMPTQAKFPVVGVLSDGAVFTVYQSTPSNKNRHRAAMVLNTFLGLDVLSLGPRIAPSTVQPPANEMPTMTNPQCEVCHRIVDGVASSFQNWDAYMQQGELEGTYGVGSGVCPDQFTPRINGTLMPEGTSEPLRWLAGALAADPRFAYTAVTTWYTILTGQKPLEDPAPNDPNYRSDLAMKLYQNQFFTEQATAFAQRNYSVKTLIKALIASPWYGATRTFEHTARRAPEVLDDLVTATMGRSWLNGAGDANAVRPLAIRDARYLTNDFRVPYGGIDSLNTLVRNDDMSAAAAAVANFMAQDMPCRAVAADFEQAKANRALFPYVNATDAPDAQAASVRANIVYLHERLLGQQLSVGDPEITATFDVFSALYQAHKGNTALATSCQTAATTTDAAGTLNAWMGTISYLMNDFDFLYQGG